jgi:hypothetical protein
MIVTVMDGQGGRIGSTIIKGLGKNPIDNVEILALGARIKGFSLVDHKIILEPL